MRGLRTSGLALVLAAIAAAAAPVAQAGPLVQSAPACPESGLEQPFLPWFDPASYVLVGDGTLEGGGEGWSLMGSSVVDGNETYYVHGLGESRSLELPRGSSATTPSICVGIEHPTLRLFARRSGSLLSALGVEVLFEDATGTVQSAPIGVVLGGSDWRPTLPLPIVVNLLPLLPGERTAVAFRFTAGPDADWAIDDVYVDPYRK